MSDAGNFLTQDELDALLGAISGANAPQKTEQKTEKTVSSGLLTPEEIDMIGEVGNIIMGSAATALFTILGKDVQITTPRVKTMKLKDLRKTFTDERLVTTLEFKEGLNGLNVLVMDKKTALIIADLMMGGTGENTSGSLDELKNSAVGEAMNQMMGAASTSMADFLHKPINITPPKVELSDFSKKDASFPLLSASGEDEIAVVSFDMEIKNLSSTNIFQLLPIPFVKELYSTVTGGSKPAVVAPSTNTRQPQGVQPSQRPADGYKKEEPGFFMPPPPQKQQPVTVQKAEFEDFTDSPTAQLPKQLELLYEVPLEITVELGRSRLTLKETLDLNIGSIIELDKLTGEHVDILVNGKVIARGEVVVVEESFGVRVTEIVNPKERLRTLR